MEEVFVLSRLLKGDCGTCTAYLTTAFALSRNITFELAV
jgi:hypothetical protein